MNRSRILCLVVILTLGLSCFAGAEGLPRLTPAVEGERVTLTLTSNGYLTYGSGDTAYVYETEAYKAICDRMNIDLQFVQFADTQQLEIAIAGNDLPDILSVDSAYTEQLIEGDMLYSYDDYAELIPNIYAVSPLRTAILRDTLSAGTGKLYFVTPQVGPEAPSLEIHTGFTVRWDMYLEMGAPKIANLDDYFDYLVAASEKYPETEDGLKIYGYGMDNRWWPYTLLGIAMGEVGYNSKPYAIKVSTDETNGEIVSRYMEADSGMWKVISFLYRLNQAGLLDPDSFTMTREDMGVKIENGQYIATPHRWYNDLYEKESQTDPNTLTSYMVLPMEGYCVYDLIDNPTGWAWYYGVTKNCEHPEAAMRFMDFLNTEEGSRMVNMGSEGTIWTYVDGVPTLTEEALENKRTMSSEEWHLNGDGVWPGWIGLSNGATLSDGGQVSLWSGIDVQTSTMTAVQKSYSEFFGVEYPAKVFRNMIDEGKAYDLSHWMQTIKTLTPSAPTNVTRIDTNCEEIFYRALPKLILAADDAAFEAAQQAVWTELTEAGIEEASAWWKEQGAIAKAYILENMQ